MSEETLAASSPAEVADVFQGQQPTMAEYSQYRESGELPERFKPAEPAESDPADAQEETEESEVEETESASESETEEEAQEQPKKGSAAEKRIKQLLAEKKELERKLAASTPTQAEPSPAQASQPATRQKPTAEDKDDKGNPKYSTYEDFVEDLADWKAEQRQAQWEAKQAQQKALEALRVKLDESRARYEDADDVIIPAAKQINEAQIPQVVKEVFAGSDLFTDLCYVVGSDPDELSKFLSLANSNPRAAIAKVFEYERGIKDELGKTSEPEKAPEVKKTAAPKPPSPVGGASSRAFDVSDESLSADEWFRKRNEQISRRKS